MGMFDSVYCDLELQVLGHVPEMEFQTKDFDCLMDWYYITAEGRLMMEAGTWFSETKKRDFHKHDMKYHGIFDFYGSKWEDDANGKERLHSFDYSAKFTDGQLVFIEYKGDHWSGDNVVGGPRWYKENYGKDKE